MKKLEEAIKKFKAAVAKARENPLVHYLDDYENWIAGNILRGNTEEARYHARLLITYYIGDNPFTPDQEEIVDKFKDAVPEIYKIMDASRKMYYVGQATKELLELM